MICRCGFDNSIQWWQIDFSLLLNTALPVFCCPVIHDCVWEFEFLFLLAVNFPLSKHFIQPHSVSQTLEFFIACNLEHTQVQKKWEMSWKMVSDCSFISQPVNLRSHTRSWFFFFFLTFGFSVRPQKVQISHTFKKLGQPSSHFFSSNQTSVVEKEMSSFLCRLSPFCTEFVITKWRLLCVKNSIQPLFYHCISDKARSGVRTL